MALILPKGIVVNSPQIKGQIERINAEPLDLADIAKFWKVYTTTKRRLLDPTAERLENYWWRIWGSRRRELNGATVARLFAYISDGQSFVPLRGPANRDEGTMPTNKPTRHGPGAASATNLHRPSQSRPSTTSSTISKGGILKKGPSLSTTTTTRTARFISPHESEVETNTNSSTRSISPNSHVVVQPPSPESQNTNKKAAVTGGSKKKGHIASTAANKKKRPVINRRQSSQSSTDSAAKVEAENANQSSAERTPPTFSEDPHNKGKAPSRFQENFSPEHLAAPPGKRPSPRKPSRKGKEVLNHSGLANSNIRENAELHSSNLHSIENQQTVVRAEDLTEEELEALELQHAILEQINSQKNGNTRSATSNQRSEDLRVPQKSIASGLANESSQQDLGAIRMLPHDAKSDPKVALANTEATGQLELNDAITRLPQVTSAKGRDKGKERDPDDLRQAELFAKRPVPTVLSTATTPVPIGDSMARSKSQLTLLLEKDRARGADKKRDGKKE